MKIAKLIPELDPYTVKDIRAFNRALKAVELYSSNCSPEVIDAVVALEKWRKNNINAIKKLMKEEKIDKKTGREVIRYFNEEFDRATNTAKESLTMCLID